MVILYIQLDIFSFMDYNLDLYTFTFIARATYYALPHVPLHITANVGCMPNPKMQ